MTQTATTYEQQALDFLTSTGTTFSASFVRNGKHFDDDKETRDIYEITLKRGIRSYKFNFGQSIMNSQYYQDRIQGRTYTLNGGCRTGNYKINDIEKYKSGLGLSNGLKLVKGEAPTPYDVLACLTKYDPGTLEDFCSEFGYDTDSKKAEKTYLAVKDEWQNVCALFTDAEIEALQEIQ
jgi:hypothetical protein